MEFDLNLFIVHFYRDLGCFFLPNIMALELPLLLPL